MSAVSKYRVLVLCLIFGIVGNQVAICRLSEYREKVRKRFGFGWSPRPKTKKNLNADNRLKYRFNSEFARYRSASKAFDNRKLCLRAKESSILLEIHALDETFNWQLSVEPWKEFGSLLIEAYEAEKCAPFYFEDMWKICCWTALNRKGSYVKFCTSYVSLGLDPPSRDPLEGFDYAALKSNRKNLKDRELLLLFKRNKKLLQYRKEKLLLSNTPKPINVPNQGSAHVTLEKPKMIDWNLLTNRAKSIFPEAKKKVETISRAVFKIDLGFEALQVGCSDTKIWTDCCT